MILCDVTMPELDGYGVLAALRADTETVAIPFIFLTAKGEKNFDSARPLETELGLTPRVAETLLWLAQGKTNGEIATILGNSESTVKKHVLEIFEKLGVETRTAASLRALEVLSSPAAQG